MAYMSQEKKAELAKGIAAVMPKNWKWSLAVRHHSTLVLTIRQADADLIGENLVVRAQLRANGLPTHHDVNEYHLSGQYSGKLLKTFEAIKAAMMVGNHDRSEPQTDYFDVGWYIDICVGKYDAPFRYVKGTTKTFGNPLNLTDTYKVSHFADTTTPRPKGMPEGLTHAQEITWMKNRIVELEASL